MHTNQSSSGGNKAWIYLLVSIVALALGIWVAMLQPTGQQSQTPVQLLGGTQLPEPGGISPFKLHDHGNQAFTEANLKGKWTFLFFGYTNCPDVCPSTLTQFRIVAEKLAAKPAHMKNTRFVFVSVDPERDTPEYLKQYVQYYNKDFIGVTGTPDEIHKFSRQMGVIYMKTPQPGNSENYLIDHSAAILLVDPAGKLNTIFSAPHNPENMVQDLITVQDHYQG